MEHNLVDTIEYRDYRIKVYIDEDTQNPRKEWDNFGHMVCWHRRYDLGDEQPSGSPSDFLRDLAIENDPKLEDQLYYWENGHGWAVLAKKHPKLDGSAGKAVDEVTDKLIGGSLSRNVVVLPLYLYDHGGITMSTGSFNDPWDSGQVGFIYTAKDEIRKEYGVKRVTKKVIEKVLDLLRSEVDEYDNYLTGRVYGYVIEDPQGEERDSCWGFYGGYNDYMVPECRGIIDSMVREDAKEAIKTHRDEVDCDAFSETLMG